MSTAPATLRVRIPALVLEPRGAIAAATLMLRLLCGIAAVTAAVLASASGRAAPAPASLLHD
jgi:hypothetical protein